MLSRCPGSKIYAAPYPEIIKCSFCNKDLEIWSDEANADCPYCGRQNTRHAKNSCLSWCKYAKDCIGENRYNIYIKNISS